MSYPLRLNIGSGAKFKDNYLNLDIDREFAPDIVFDLNQPLLIDGLRQFDTERFGPITLRANSFESIAALDVLEHLRHLDITMTSCLELLRVGGFMHIFVPYDLSLGAWQDPGHVRAFNENSWKYYCEWFWRLGWNQARFARHSLAMVLSPYGEELQRQGSNMEQLSRAPRAVEHMQVVLQKVSLSAEDRQTLAQHRPGLAACSAGGV